MTTFGAKFWQKSVFSGTVISKILAGAATVIKPDSETNNMRSVLYEKGGELLNV